MDLLKHYYVPIAIIIGFMVVSFRNRYRPFALKHALLVNFLAACFCAGPMMRAGWRPALTLYLFMFIITSLAAACRWSEHPYQRATLSVKESTKKVQL